MAETQHLQQLITAIGNLKESLGSIKMALQHAGNYKADDGSHNMGIMGCAKGHLDELMKYTELPHASRFAQSGDYQHISKMIMDVGRELNLLFGKLHDIKS